MDHERKMSVFRLDNQEKQRLAQSVNTMITMLEKANLSGGFTLKDSAEIVQALGTVTQFVNQTLPQL